MSTQNQEELSKTQENALLNVLQARFEQHPHRHPGLAWEQVRARLEAHPEKRWSLQQMEATGGEPDVVEVDEATGAYVFYDCSAESPAGRRGLCYDPAGLDARKEHKPNDSAVGLATAMGIALLTEAQYRQLQQFGPFDAKTSSWLATPAAIRQHGGALFGDYRYGHVFVYHNGASAYYAVRGFRGCLRV